VPSGGISGVDRERKRFKIPAKEFDGNPVLAVFSFSIADFGFPWDNSRFPSSYAGQI